MKKLLLLALSAMMGLAAHAEIHYLEIGGLKFSCNSQTKTGVCTGRTDDQKDKAGAVTIPSTTWFDNVDYKIIGISNYAFAADAGLTSVNIGYNMQEIGQCAFQNCTKLTWVRLPSSVTTIRDRAFNGCVSLNMVMMAALTPPACEYSAFIGIGASARLMVPYYGGVKQRYQATSWKGRFASVVNSALSFDFNHNGLTYVILKDDPSHGEVALTGCNTNAASVQLPYSIMRSDLEDHKYYVAEIGDSALMGNQTLERFNGEGAFNPYMRRVGKYALANCPKLATVKIKADTIMESAFAGNTLLTTLDLTGVKRIKDDAFYNCGMTTVTIPKSLVVLYPSAFQNCPKLQSYALESGTTRFKVANGMLFNSNSTILYHNPAMNTSNELPLTCEVIYTGAFRGKANVTRLFMPYGCTTVMHDAFYGSSLRSIWMPATMSVIQDNAFRGCANLDTVGCNAQVPPTISNSAFPRATTSTLFTPLGAKVEAAYHKANGWTRFRTQNLRQATLYGQTRNYRAGACDFVDKEHGVNSYAYTVINDRTVKLVNSAACANNVGMKGKRRVPQWVGPVGRGYYEVTELDREAFLGPQDTYSLEANSVKKVGALAFRYQQGMGPDTITLKLCSAVGDSAFFSNSNLAQVNFNSDSISDIGDRAFYGTAKLKKYFYLPNVASVGTRAFENAGIIWFDAGRALTQIGGYAFCNAPNLLHLGIAGINSTRLSTSWYTPFFGNNSPIFKAYFDMHEFGWFYSRVQNWPDNADGTKPKDAMLPSISLPAGGWDLVSCAKSFQLPDEVKAYRITSYAGGKLVASELETGAVIGANKAVLIQGKPRVTYCTKAVTGTHVTPRDLLQAVNGLNSPLTVKKNGDYYLYEFNTSDNKFHQFTTKTYNMASGYLQMSVDVPVAEVDIISGGSLKGDLNGDGVVNTQDITVLVNAVLSGSTQAAYDIDGDGGINTTDITALVSLVLAGS